MTALRIIEREEKSDQECLQRQKSTGFMAMGRPKKWKEKCMAVLRTNVQERIEGNQLESRVENKVTCETLPEKYFLIYSSSSLYRCG